MNVEFTIKDKGQFRKNKINTKVNGYLKRVDDKNKKESFRRPYSVIPPKVYDSTKQIPDKSNNKIQRKGQEVIKDLQKK